MYYQRNAVLCQVFHIALAPFYSPFLIMMFPPFPPLSDMNGLIVFHSAGLDVSDIEHVS